MDSYMNLFSEELLSLINEGEFEKAKEILEKSTHLFHAIDAFSEELLSLINEGEFEKAKEILEKSTYLFHATDAFGATLLHYSVRQDNEYFTQYLLNKGCDVNMQDSEGITPLMIAVMKNHVSIIEILLDAGADIFKLNIEKKSALHMIITQYDIPSYIVTKFLEEIKRKFCNEEVAEKLIDADCRLYYAILLKDSKIIESMLKRGSPVDSAHPIHKVTALHVAVVLDDSKSVSVLLKYGASPNEFDLMNETPLYNLYKRNKNQNREKIEILNMLVNQGVSMTSCTSGNGIFQAYHTLVSGNSEADSILLQSGMHFNVKDDQYHQNILHYLAGNKNPGVAEKLQPFVKKINVNGCDKFGQSPLLIAVVEGNNSMVKLLLKQGARTDLKHSRHGTTALYYAYLWRKSVSADQYNKCGEILLQYGADPQFVIEKKGGKRVTIFDTMMQKNYYSRMKPIIAHLALLQKFNTQITELTWMKINSHYLLKKYFYRCRWLLAKQISKGVTIFDLLISEKKKMARYLNNENLSRKLIYTGYKRQMKHCSYYCNVLGKRYLEGKRYKELKEKAAQIICTIFQNRIDKTHLIIDNITDHLNDQSLRQLYRLHHKILHNS